MLERSVSIVHPANCFNPGKCTGDRDLHFSGNAGVIELNITAQRERRWLVNQTTRFSVQNSPHCRSPHPYLATIPYLQSSTVNPITMTGRLEGKVAIVTGAGSGYGRGIAKKFVEEGGRVIIAELSEKSGEEAAAELNSTFFLTDVTKKESWRNLLQTVLDKHGQLDIVVNNAGATYLNKPTVDVTEEDFELCMNVNVKSIYLSTNVIVPYFLENKRPGCFIQISSTAALRPRPRLTWYNASKAAVCNASKTMAVEYGPDNIRFNCICPVIGITGM